MNSEDTGGNDFDLVLTVERTAINDDGDINKDVRLSHLAESYLYK